jgi:hypothetical protein
MFRRNIGKTLNANSIDKVFFPVSIAMVARSKWFSEVQNRDKPSRVCGSLAKCSCKGTAKGLHDAEQKRIFKILFGIRKLHQIISKTREACMMPLRCVRATQTGTPHGHLNAYNLPCCSTSSSITPLACRYLYGWKEIQFLILVVLGNKTMPRQTIPDKISIVRPHEARSLLIDRVVASDNRIMAQGHVTGLNGEAICLLESVSAKRRSQRLITCFVWKPGV